MALPSQILSGVFQCKRVVVNAKDFSKEKMFLPMSCFLYFQRGFIYGLYNREDRVLLLIESVVRLEDFLMQCVSPGKTELHLCY